MNLAALRLRLLQSPSKEGLIEIINAAQLPNPAIKALVFMAINNASDRDIIHFSNVIAVALQYLEQGNMEGLNHLFQSQNIPQPMVNMIMAYVSNYTSQ